MVCTDDTSETTNQVEILTTGFTTLSGGLVSVPYEDTKTQKQQSYHKEKDYILR